MPNQKYEHFCLEPTKKEEIQNVQDVRAEMVVIEISVDLDKLELAINLPPYHRGMYLSRFSFPSSWLGGLGLEAGGVYKLVRSISGLDAVREQRWLR